MIKQNMDEFSFYYKNKEYILNSKLGSLLNIEKELGYTISKMLSKWKSRGVLTSEAVVVFKNTMKTEGESSNKISNKLLRKKEFLNLLKMVVPVFIRALTQNNSNVETGDDNIWDEMFAVAVLHMGIEPRIFWQMTLNEFHILSKYYQQDSEEKMSISEEDVKDIKDIINRDK